MDNIKNQIGCGYCVFELTCKIREPKINKVKLGCEKFKHHESGKSSKNRKK